jgi:hypothetical protein
MLDKTWIHYMTKRGMAATKINFDALKRLMILLRSEIYGFRWNKISVECFKRNLFWLRPCRAMPILSISSKERKGDLGEKVVESGK